MEMTAREMFEKLGYYQDLDNSYHVGYVKRITETKIRTITFIKSYRYFTFIDSDNNCCVDLEELKAINKQIEELRWDNAD